MVHKKSKFILCPFKSENTPEKTWTGGSFHLRAFLCYILSCVLLYFFKIQRSLFLSLSVSLIHSLIFSAAMRVDAAHTDCSQHSDSPLLIQTHTDTSTNKRMLIPSISCLSVLHSSEYSVQLQMHQLLLVPDHIRGS